jgi:hypothetical protein
LAFPFGRRQFYTRTPRFGQGYCNRLFGRTRPVYAFADMVEFLAHKFARLGGGRLPLTLVMARPLDGFPLWHKNISNFFILKHAKGFTAMHHPSPPKMMEPLQSRA